MSQNIPPSMFKDLNTTEIKQAENLWKMLDEMAESDPESYKKFIEKNIREGIEQGKETKKDTKKDSKKDDPAKNNENKKTTPTPDNKKSTPVAQKEVLFKAPEVSQADMIGNLKLSTEATASVPKNKPLIQIIGGDETDKSNSLPYNLKEEGNKYIIEISLTEENCNEGFELDASENCIKFALKNYSILEIPIPTRISADNVQAVFKKKKKMVIITAEKK